MRAPRSGPRSRGSSRALPAALPDRGREPASAKDSLEAYLAFLSERNEEMNLVSARAADAGGARGATSSTRSSACPFFRRPARRRSASSISARAAGFPAVPLLLVRRDVEGTLVDSMRKKCAFLAEAAERLSLTARSRER